MSKDEISSVHPDMNIKVNAQAKDYFLCSYSKYATYCHANQEWQWRNILFTIVKEIINLYTTIDLTRIDRSFVY